MRQVIRPSSILLTLGVFFLLVSPLVLSGRGQLVFWGIGAACALLGLYSRAIERRQSTPDPVTKDKPRLSGTMKVILLCGLMILTSLPIWYPYSPAGRQAIRMQQAKEHIPRVLPLIRADSRFVLVEVAPATVKTGSLGVWGCVRTDKDRADLERLIQSTAPPVDASFAVWVAGDSYDAMLAANGGHPATTPASAP